MSSAFSWVNHVQASAVSGYTYSAAPAMTSFSEDSAYPFRNLLDPRPSKVARFNFSNLTGSNKDGHIRFDFSTADNKTVRVMAALNVRFVGTDITFIQLAAKTLANVWPASGITTGYWIPIPGTTDRYNFFHILSANQTVSGMAFAFRIPTGKTGYFEIGHLWAGPAIVETDGIAPGWELEGEDQSDVFNGPGGSLALAQVQSSAVMSLSLAGRSHDSMLGLDYPYVDTNWRHFTRQAGIGSRVLVINERNSNELDKQVLSMYGSIAQMPKITDAGGNMFNSTLKVRENR